MELDSLRTALDSDGDEPAFPVTLGGGSKSGFLEQLYARHGHSTQFSSKQLLAVASALKEMVEAEGLDPTPTALFAASMSSLERQELGSSADLLTPVCQFLDALLPYVPNAVLRSKFGSASAVLQPLVEVATTQGNKGGSSALARPALGALCQMLAAFDPGEWVAALPSFSLVLRLCSDTRPKLRKRAQEGIVDVLVVAGSRPATLSAASGLIGAEAERLLAAPEAAARAAAAAPHKKQRTAENAIVVASAAALHLLGLLRRVLPLLSPEHARSVAKSALALLPLHQPLLSRHAAETIGELYQATTTAQESMASAALSVAEVISHLRALLSIDLAVAERRDAECAAARIRLPLLCLLRLHDLESSQEDDKSYVHTLDALPRVARFLLPLLSAELDVVRGAALEAAVSCVKKDTLLDAATVRAAALAASKPGKPTGVVAFVTTLDALLSPAHQDAWPAAFRISSELFASLGRGPGSLLVEPLLHRLDGMCTGAMEGAEGETNDELVVAAQACMGSALCTLGPRSVLEVLPLGILEALRSGNDSEARTWMLPLLRRYAGAGEAAFWRDALLPLAAKLGRLGADAARRKVAQEAKVCHTLESQIWNTLPAFLNWAEDAGSVWRSLEQALIAAFKRNEQYQTIVWNALSTICINLLSFFSRAGQPLGYAAPGSVFAAEEEAGAETADPAHANEDDRTDFAPTVRTARTALTSATLTGSAASNLGRAPGPRSRSGTPPAWYTPELATGNLQEIRAASAQWLPALLDGFLGTNSSHQGLIHSTLALLSRVCEPAAVARAFKAVGAQAIKSATVQTADNDGSTLPDASERGPLLELALALAAGLDARGIAPLIRLARPLLTEQDSGLQKKAYKVLAYVCSGQREDYTSDPAARALLLELILGGQSASMSPARRYRLRAVKWAVLELLRGDNDEDARDENARATVSTLVGEIVLSLKEINAKTRIMAFDVLVELAHALHDLRPPSVVARHDDMDMEEGNDAQATLAHMGGLSELVTVVLGGLVGATPHMISASVMALARLIHEFSALLLGLVPDLLPAVLSLLRSKAREIVKSVLGFVKVIVSRLPAAELTPLIPDIVRGILLWAEETKNKFRLRVKIILERLIRRCGIGAVEPSVPESHRALIAHVRKDVARQERRRGTKSEMGDDVRSRKTGGLEPPPPGSAWDPRGVFSVGASTAGRRSEKTARTTDTKARSGKQPASSAISTEPLDLRDAAAGRELMRAAAAAGSRRGAGSDGEDDNFPRDDTGRLVVRDPEAAPRKRGRGSEFFDSDDSDFEDLREFTGIDLALKGAQSVARAPTIAASIGGGSLARTTGGASRRSAAITKSRKAEHSGARFKASKAEGDVKKGKLEPYAYWPLDRRLMNRRSSKARGAKEGLREVVGRSKGRRPAKRVKPID